MHSDVAVVKYNLLEIRKHMFSVTGKNVEISANIFRYKQ
jgi:hypothetical protein